MKEAGRFRFSISFIQSKAAIELCKELKQYYEERMELIASPYYALLAKKDIEAYEQEDGTLDEQRLEREVKEGNREFADYVRLYLRCKHSPFSKGKDYRPILDAKVRRIQNETRDQDLIRVSKLNIDLTRSGRESFNIRYQSVLSDYYSQYEDMSDIEYILNTPLNTGRAKIEGLEAADIQEMEKLFVEICEKKTINGVKVTEEEASHVKGLVKNLAAFRRRLNAVIKAGIEMEATHFSKIDLDNPAFAETPEAKAFKEMYDEENLSIPIDEGTKLRTEYMNLVIREMRSLALKGYPVFPKYEGRVSDEEFIAKGVENYRKNRLQADYYREHPLKNGETEKRIKFPAIRLNGKSYCIYNIKDELQLLAGEEIELKEEDPGTKEAIELLERIEALSRKLTAVGGEYGFQDHEKQFVRSVYNIKITKERTPLVKRFMVLAAGGSRAVKRVTKI